MSDNIPKKPPFYLFNVLTDKMSVLLTGKGRKDGGAVGFYERLGFTRDEKHAMTIRKVPKRDDTT